MEKCVLKGMKFEECGCGYADGMERNCHFFSMEMRVGMRWRWLQNPVYY